MPTVDSERNPLKPLSLPFAVRAAVAGLLAVSMLTRYAPAMMGGFSGSSSVALLAALLLLALAWADGAMAFRTGLRLPERSLEGRGIGATYTADEILALMVSGASPNEKYLSLIGRWAERASERFFRLPPPYQRLVEVALTAVAFVAMALLFAPLLQAFGDAGGRPEISQAVLSWLFAGFVIIGYVFWSAMLIDIYSASRWVSTISAGSIVKNLGSLLVLAALLAFATTYFGVQVAAAPSLQPFSAIAIGGTAVMVIGIIVLALLRSDEQGAGMERSRIHVSDSAAVHPQSILNALRGIISKPIGGIYSELGQWNITLSEQHNMSAGTFSALAVGEYGAKIEKSVSSRPLRSFAIAFSVIGIFTGAVAYVMLWNAVRQSSFGFSLSAVALLLFGTLALLIGSFPLSEKLWRSYLIGFEIQGNYQSRGSVVMTASGQNAGYGSVLIDYRLDGGVASAHSASFVNASLAKSDARRVLIGTSDAAAERETIVHTIRAHLTRAAGGGAG